MVDGTQVMQHFADSLRQLRRHGWKRFKGAVLCAVDILAQEELEDQQLLGPAWRLMPSRWRSGSLGRVLYAMGKTLVAEAYSRSTHRGGTSQCSAGAATGL